jgi:hypothetical protein
MEVECSDLSPKDSSLVYHKEAIKAYAGTPSTGT